jgi:mRNA interferase RelE/StbE
VKYTIELSSRAARDLDRLGRDVQERMMRRLEQLSKEPYDARLSGPLTNRGHLRKSRVGGWRILFTVDDQKRSLRVVTIERRGQVYQRL